LVKARSAAAASANAATRSEANRCPPMCVATMLPDAAAAAAVVAGAGGAPVGALPDSLPPGGGVAAAHRPRARLSARRLSYARKLFLIDIFSLSN